MMVQPQKIAPTDSKGIPNQVKPKPGPTILPLYPSIELFLLDIGRSALGYGRAIGYFPLKLAVTHERNSKTQHVVTYRKLTPASVLRSLLMITITLFWNLYYFKYRHYILQVHRKYGPTELVTVFLSEIITQSVMNGLRLIGWWHSHGTRCSLAFWRMNCETLGQLTRNGAEIWINEELYNAFMKIKRQLRWISASFVVPAILFTGLRYGIYFYNSTSVWLQLDKDGQVKTFVPSDTFGGWSIDWHQKYLLGAMISSLITGFHFGHMLVVLFYLKLYCLCFNLIGTKIGTASGHGKEQSSPAPVLIYHTELDRGEPLPSPASTRELILRQCLSMLQCLHSQVIAFNQHFSLNLIAEIFLCIANILTHSFFTCVWVFRGSTTAMSILTSLAPALFYFKILYHLATESGALTRANKRIVQALQNTPYESGGVGVPGIGTDVQAKIQLHAITLATSPLRISPGHYFILNRQLITSVLSSLATFLIVLVQFKESDEDDATLTWFRHVNATTGGTRSW